MTRALHHHFQMFHHVNVDEVYRKIEVLLPIHMNLCYKSFISFDKKNLKILHTILKETLALFKTLKVIVHHAQLLAQRKHLSLMLDYVGKDFANNKPRCLIILKRNNCKP